MYEPQQAKARKSDEVLAKASERGEAALGHERSAAGGYGYTQSSNNQATKGTTHPFPIQPKLLLGSSGDPFEQEAEQVAQRVSAGATAQATLTLRGPGAGAQPITQGVEQAIRGAQGGGEPLAAGVRGTMERALGADFGAVRVHTDARADSLNQALRASAFTTGPDIFFRRGGYAPGGAAGRDLLAHELTHVVQQGAAPALAEGALGRGSVGGTAVVQRAGGGENEDEAPLVQNNVVINAPPQPEGDEYGLEPIINELADEMEQENIIDEVIEEMNEEQQARSQHDQALGTLPDTPEVAATYKDWAELKAMTLEQLAGYAQTQADWHVSTSLSDKERKQVWTVLAFARQDDAILAGSGPFKVEAVDQLIQDKGEKGVFEALSLYSTVVQSQKPFELRQADTPTMAMQWGIDLKKLRTKMGDATLATGMHHIWFKELSNRSFTDDLITYYTTAKPTPIFQAERGKDVASYLTMRVDDAKDPLDYHNNGTLVGKVRNFHRFEKAALDKLEANYKDTSKAKPLTLILHSGLDHTGAYHRDSKLTEVITNNTIQTLMIEGKETLADVQNQLEPLSKTYGKNNRIDQVMFAGHGGSRNIQMAGKVEEQGGRLEEVRDDMDLDDPEQKKKTDALFVELLKYLDKKGDVNNIQPHQRALFNACLTNSNVYHGAQLDWDPTKAREQVREYLSQHSSFATYFQDFADKGDIQITSLGANASIRTVDLIEPVSGKLDLISGEDPTVTSSKLVYVEQGNEPGGVLKAVLELWSTDDLTAQQELWDAMLRRFNKGPNTSWTETITRILFYLILKFKWKEAPYIHHFGYMAAHLTYLHVQESLGVPPSSAKGLFTGGDLNDYSHMLFQELAKTNAWRDIDFLSLVLSQNWIQAQPNEALPRTQFLARLDKLTCQRAKKFVDFTILGPIIAELLANPVKPGQLNLALLDILSTAPSNESKQFLIDLTVDDKFPIGLKVGEKLAGLATEDDILIAIGKKEKPNVNNVVAPVNKPGNVAVGGSDKNTLAMQSVTKRGKINTAEGANLYKKPDRTSDVLKVLDQNEEVTIFAAAGGWFAVEYKDGIIMKSAFVNKASITLL